MAKKRRASAAQKARLKALRRKHGLGEFKKSSRRVSTKRVSRSTHMAKKRRVTRKRGFSGFGAVGNVAIGAAAYGFIRAPIQQATAGLLGGVADEILLGVLSAFVAMNTSGIIRNVALGGVAIETSTFVKGLNLGGTGNGVVTTTSNIHLIG